MSTQITLDPPEATAIDSSLDELRVSRRLQNVTVSIESFLHNQVQRLETALQQCEKVEQQNEMLKRMFAEFEKTKRDWEKMRLQEEQRLYEAGQKLVFQWEQLETEKSKLGLG